MISRVKLYSNTMVVGGPEWTTDGQEFVADWELCRSRCRKCGEIYNTRLYISEWRPVLHPTDVNLPTLLVLPGGFLSPAGRFSFHSLLPDGFPCTRLNHYYRKDECSLLILMESGGLNVFNTRRYTNPEMWPGLVKDPVTGVATGYIGWAERDFSTVYMAVDARFVELPDFHQEWTTHRRCEEAECTHTFKVGCTEIKVDTLQHEVRVKDWSCQILPADQEWSGTTKEFDRSGKTAPVSPGTIDDYYLELLRGFETLNIDFYVECEETEAEDYPSTGRVAFKWRG